MVGAKDGDWVRGSLYLLGIAYCFIGLSAITGRFFRSMERVVKQTYKVVVTDPLTKLETVTHHKVWNYTIADITLLAFGTSFPQISLAIIDSITNIGNRYAGGVGPGTLVGSAAFDLFPIHAVCVIVPKAGELKKITDLGVWLVELFWSFWAYIWLYIIIMVWTPNVITVWESLLTVLQFGILLLHAYAQDKRWPYLSLPISKSERPSEWVPEEEESPPRKHDILREDSCDVSHVADHNRGNVVDVISVHADDTGKIGTRQQVTGLLSQCDYAVYIFCIAVPDSIVFTGSSLPLCANMISTQAKIQPLGVYMLAFKNLVFQSVHYNPPSINLNVSELQQLGRLYQPLPPDEVVELSYEQVQRSMTADDASVLSLWKQQFVDALTFEQNKLEGKFVKSAKIIWYLLLLPWRVMYAFVPPYNIAHGWISFICSLIFISGISYIVTMFTDLISSLTGINAYVIAFTLLAAGASWPDLVASKIAAQRQATADTAIANIICSNSVNIYVGIGIPWLIDTTYNYFAYNEPLRIENAAGISYSLQVFFCTAIGCISVLVLRRILFGAELGGPRIWAWITCVYFIILWLIFVILSSLKLSGLL